LVLILGAALVLGGCAAQKAFREGKDLIAGGKYAEGIARLEEAEKLDPGNIEYRMFLANGRANVVRLQLSQADVALGQGRHTEAETLFRSAQRFDPRNPMAQAGIDALAMERRHRHSIKDAEEHFKKNNLREMEEILRVVLVENPGQKEAKNLQARLAEKRAQEKTPEMKLAVAFRKPITLEFRDASLRSVFDMISKVSGINFFFDKDLRPDLKANISAKNTAVEDAIRLLLVTNQLEQRVLNENSILIYPNIPQKLKDYQNLMVRSFYLANADAKMVANTLKTILKTKDIVVNEKLNMVIIRDTNDAVRLAEKLVALEDVGEAEVMLELEVLEVQRSRLLALGVQWPNQLTLSVGSSAAGAGTLATAAAAAPGTALTLDNLFNLNSRMVNASMGSMIVNAKKVDSDSDILANPRIRVRNREKAKIMIGDRVPVITTTSTSTGFVSESVNYVDVGLKLEVEPNIYLDEEVAIKLSLEVSSIVKQVTSASGTLSYQIGTRNAATVLKLKDGETQILGGLIHDQDTRSANKVPGLGEFPILGRLFGNHQNDSQKTEIILTITPRLLRTVRRPDLVVAEFDSGTETTLGGRSLSLGTVVSEGDVKRGSVSPSPGGNGVGVRPAAAAEPPAKPAPAAETATAPLVAAIGGFRLNWQGPPQVKVGDQFSLTLRLQSQPAIASLPMLIGFDPSLLQVVGVTEGDFLKQAGGQTNFTSRIDSQGGQIVIGVVRQGGGINGLGSVVSMNFKAIKAAPKASVQLLSASPDPAPSGTLPTLPLAHGLAITN